MSGSGQVVVVGSINVDYVFAVDGLPEPGETVGGASFDIIGGGKGANQAAAAASVADRVTLLAAVGDDRAGREAIEELGALRVDTSLVARIGGVRTGAAAVVTSDLDNQIAVAGGANDHIDVEILDSMIASLPEPDPGEVWLVSAEIPEDTVDRAIVAGTERGAAVIYNAAPARDLTPAIDRSSPLLVVNEAEGFHLSGLASVELSGHNLVNRLGRPVVTTLGGAGALMFEEHEVTEFHAESVDVVDTTGAGDAFCGVMAGAMSLGVGIKDAITRGMSAGSAVVQHHGARTWLER